MKDEIHIAAGRPDQIEIKDRSLKIANPLTDATQPGSRFQGGCIQDVYDQVFGYESLDKMTHQ